MPYLIAQHPISANNTCPQHPTMVQYYAIAIKIIFKLKLYNFYYLFVGLLLITACTEFTPNKKNDDKRYFDLIAYFDQQDKKLENSTVNKTITLNQKTETKQLNHVNWQQELSVFADSDINKPAFRDSYQTDSTLIGDTLRITYTARTPKLRTQTLRLDWLKSTQSIAAIAINNRVDNPLYQLSEQLYYLPLQAYSIKSQQKIRLLAPNKLEIKASMVQVAAQH